jgi:hypothetical protein
MTKPGWNSPSPIPLLIRPSEMPTSAKYQHLLEENDVLRVEKKEPNLN